MDNEDFIAGGNTGGKSGLQRAPHQVKSLGNFFEKENSQKVPQKQTAFG